MFVLISSTSLHSAKNLLEFNLNSIAVIYPLNRTYLKMEFIQCDEIYCCHQQRFK